MRQLTCVLACTLAIVMLPGSGTRGQTPAPAGVQAFDAPVPGARSPRNANYEIDVRLDHAARMLHGRQTISWRNISRADTSELRLHLYWNAWRSVESTWLRGQRLARLPLPSRPEDFAWIDLLSVRVHDTGGIAHDLTAAQQFVAPDDGNVADRTVVAIPLPFTVRPQDSLRIEIEWTSRIPFPFTRLRTGRIGDYYFIAQWFPKIAVLEDAGWRSHQFHSHTEFYADFGSYDVRITVPDQFIVGASGREVARTPLGDGTTTHHYRGDDITDVAWTASPHFLDIRERFEHPQLPAVDMRLLLQPEHAGQRTRHFAATAATLRLFGEWFGAYPYDHVTIVDPAYQSGSQGMEYPTLFTAGSRLFAPEAVTVPDGVTIHEAGHQWWHGVVSTNEVLHAWMDEGPTTFATARVIDQSGLSNHLALRYFGGFVPWVVRDIRLSRATDGNRLPGYRAAPSADAQDTPTYRYWPTTAAAITYNKTALWLHTLERHLGWPVLRQILATYFERWQFRHPRPEDFFAVANEVSGQDLTWFFDEVYRSSNVFDYGMQELRSDRVESAPPQDSAALRGQPDAAATYRTTVVVRRYGEATFPVDVLTTFADGERIRERWDGRARRAVYVYERPSRATRAHVDPDRVLLLDVNYTNNSVTFTPRADEASLKWSLRWMVWLQDLMLTYSFFL